MTLSDMADFVCGKVRQTDTRAVAKCKEFLRQRYELIYNEALWRDSLYLFTFTFTPNDSGLPYKPESYDSTYMMPSVVDKVVAIRTAGQEITAAGQEVFMRGAADQFAQTGSPVEFATLAPCVALLPETYPFHDAALIGGDVGTAYTAYVVDSTGARTKLTGTIGSGTLSLSSDARVIERVSRVSAGSLMDLTVDATDRSIVEVAVGDFAFPSRIPVRLIPGPTGAVDLKALVKKKVLPLSDDGDTPELRNVDNALLAFAQGDMWEYARQIGKAQAKYAEAGAVLTQLQRVHAWQEQTLPRAIPDVGDVSGDIGGTLAGKGYW